MAAPSSSISKKPKPKESSSYLPDDLWEHIFKILNGADHYTLSAVSKQFLSITNRLRSSLKITNHTLPFLPRRFPNLTSIDLTRLPQTSNIDAIFIQIAAFPYDLRALSCNKMPVNGLIALSKTMKNLKSFSCSKMPFINRNHLFYIGKCFPLLEELTLTFPFSSRACDFLVDDNQVLKFPKLRKIDLSGNRINDEFVVHVWKSCDVLEEFIPWFCVAKKLR